MPHSSGGGSSGGGGFHSGSSSSGPTTRTSSHYFPGASCYVYYDRRGRARTLYTNQNPAAIQKTKIATYLLFGLLLIVPFIIIPVTGNHSPSMLSKNYEHSIVIQDQIGAFSDDEEAALTKTFQEFFDASGICPSLISIDNASWKNHYSKLEGYAYDAYINRFSDESHWLIVYSADDAAKTNWAFEGMQGDDTDGILTKKVTDIFNKTVYDNLGSVEYTAGEAIDSAFRAILPTLMDHYFYVEPTIWVFCAVWETVILVTIVFAIIGQFRNKNLKNAVKIDGEPNMTKCPHCGNPYVEGTIDRCPKCQAFLDPSPVYAHYKKEDK